MSSSNPVLVEVYRGTTAESVHRGAVAVVDGDGALVAAIGDIDRPVFPRSAIKLLQALPLVAGGAADRLGLVDEELALACASHGGEAPHVRTAAAMLAKAGVDAGVLECGTHWPYQEQAARALAAAGLEPGPLHNNCSGKHAGFVCVGCMLAAGSGQAGDLRGFLRGYVQPGHAVMREVGAAVSAATGTDVERAPRGVDGCSVPTWALPLRSLALAFARVASGQGLSPGHAAAALRLRRAVARAPFMVGGTGRFDTRVMEHFGERVCCKVGAEGVHCAALPERGWGVAVKMDDGNTSRACEVAMAALIEAALPLSADDAAFLRSLSDARLRNRNGIEVGHIAAAAPLRRLALG